MLFEYNKREGKGFAAFIEEKIRSSMITIDLTSLSHDDGYIGSFVIDIQKKGFEVSSWKYPDQTRFPARIKAAATALFRLGMLGKYKIAHDKGKLVISRP